MPVLIDDRVPDEKLIAQWQTGVGREKIAEILVERYAPRVGGFFLRLGFSDDTRHDLTQEVFLRAFRGLTDFRSDASFQFWIFQVARNISRTFFRHQQTQKRSAQEVSLSDADRGEGIHARALDSVESHSFVSPLDRVLAEERTQILRDAVAELEPAMRHLLILVFQGHSMNEIATLLDIPAGTVKSRLSKARNTLRNKLWPRLKQN